MSATIDQRVVEMRFDNKHFESNVAQTMSTLDKLKAKLNLPGASKGLDSINTAAKNVNMAGLGSAVDTVTARFSALQVMGVTALANITNSAVNAGKRIVKSLTIDPIKTGFDEYETKMGSIQTILANTQHEGTNLDQVTAALDELNLYADKTIYNFQEMTRNIGTFTAAGVSLDSSVRSIQGIANLAAISGSTSQQASTAMYQLSQALSSGTVKLMDWNSVVNAGMGGKVFQDALKRTAEVMGTNVDALIEKYGSFRETLSTGWVTSDVLTKTLEQFTMAAEEGSEQWEKFKKSLMDDGYTEKQAEEILKMANTATDAATKVKTFTQLMDTLKESAQSGWAQTWELIVGDFEEAKAFFTELSDLFGGIIGKSADRRNSFLTEVFGSNWDKLISRINEAGVKTEQFEESIRKVVGENKLDSLVEKYGSIQKAAEEGAISSDVLKKALDGIGMTDADGKIAGFVEGLKEINRELRRGNYGEDVKKLQTALDELGYDLGDSGIDGIIGPITEKAIKAFQEANGLVVDGVAGPDTLAALEKAGGKYDKINNNIEDIRENCDSLADVITKTSGRELLLTSLMNIIKAIQRPLSAVGEALRNTFSISPETLYNGLVKLEKITSKFVPNGILDATTWNKLLHNIEKIGISGPEFVGKLKESLADNGVDVDSLIKKYGTLAKAFEAGAISVDIIKETLLNFDGVTETLLNGGETADKIRRTFEGLFAVFDIIGTLAGSGLKIAFEMLSGVLSHFDMDILDLAANIADTIVDFRDWLDSVIDVKGAVEAIMPYVEGFAKAIAAGFESFKGTEEYEKLISFFSNAASAFMEWIEVLKSSENIGEDIVAGLIAGLTAGVGAVWGAALALAQSILESICSFLGIHSPATTMIEVGKNVIEGLTIGLQNGVTGLWSIIKDIGEKLLEWFKNIDFGAIFSIGIAASMIYIVKIIGDALSILATPFEGFGHMLEDLGDMFEGLGSKFKAEAWEKRANAIKSFAIAIAILAASAYILGTQMKPSQLLVAVAALAALAGVIALLSFAVGKFGTSAGSGPLSKLKQFISSAVLTSLSLALLGIAAVVKIIGSMSLEQAKQGILGAVGLIAALAVFIASCSLLGLTKHSKNVGKVGGMMIALSIALMLMVAAVKLISNLSPNELATGAHFITAFLAFTALFAALGAIPGNGIEGVGTMMLKISAALLLMIWVVKLAGQLSNENGELAKANWFIGGFIGLVLLLRLISLIPGNDMSKLGGTLMGISGAMLIMAGVAKLIATMEWGDMGKAAVGLLGFTAIITLLRLISLIPGNDMSKLGGTLMGISGAMLIMAGVAKLIATMEWGDMGKAAVGLLGLTGIIALLVAIVKKMGSDVPKIAGTLLAISVAMSILAGIAILMGMLKVEHLAKGLAAVTVLGLVMAAMLFAARGVKNCTGELVAMTVAVGLMAAAVAALSMIDPGPLATATAAMAVLMGMFAIVVKSANNINTSVGALITVTAAILILSGIVYLLAGLPVENVIGVAGSLSVLLLSLSVSIKILSTINGASMSALGSMGILILVVAGIAAILGVMAALNCAPSIETAASISLLLLAMAAVYTILGVTGGLAGTAIIGAAGMMAVIAIIGGIAMAIGYLMSLIPEDKISEWKTGLENFMDFITILTTGLGEAIGGLVGGILEGVSGGIETFSGSITKLTEALGPFAEAARKLDAESVAGVHNLVDLVTAITANNFLETIGSCFGGSSMETFAGQLKAFGIAMKDYAAEVVGLDTASIINSVTAAKGLVQVAQAIPGDGLLGLDGIDDFGRNIVTFGKSLAGYAVAVAGVDLSAVSNSVLAAKNLILIGNILPDDGFLGLDGIDDFGRNIKTFGESLAAYAAEVAELDSSAVMSSVAAAQGLLTVARLIPDDGTLGMDGIDDFGKNIKSFGSSMKSYSEQVVGIDIAAVNSSISAARTVRSFITSLSGLDTSGVDAFKSAVKQLSKVNLDGIAESFNGAVSKLKVIGADMGSAIAEGLRSKQSQTKAVVATLINETVTMFRTKLNSFKTAGENLGTGFTTGLKNKENAAIDAGKSLGTKASSGASTAKSSMTSAGYDLGNGLVAGINAMVGAAYSAGYALGQAAVQGEKDGQASASPSKETIKAGKWLGEGLVIGMERMGRAVYNAGSTMGKDAVSSISNSVRKISDTINSDIDAQPTIRPIMDLSDVKTGVNAIGNMLNTGSNIGVLANVSGISTMMNRRSQNGTNSEVVSAIDKLRKDIGNVKGNSYNIGDVSYDDGSAVGNAVLDLVRAMRVEGRI